MRAVIAPAAKRLFHAERRLRIWQVFLGIPAVEGVPVALGYLGADDQIGGHRHVPSDGS